MAAKNTIKQQRDRFLAFAFASADLFLEIAEDGKVAFVTGATKGLTGVDEKAIMDKDWLELFDTSEHETLNALRDNAKPGLRQGPAIVQLNPGVADRKGILTAISMPDSKSLYLTLSVSNALSEKLTAFMSDDENAAMVTGFEPDAEKKTESVTTDFDPEDDSPDAVTTGFTAENEDQDAMTTGFTAEDEDFNDSLYNKTQFLAEADEIFEFARTSDIDAEITTFTFENTQAIPEDSYAAMFEQVTALMKESALAHKAAAQINENTFTIIHTKDTDLTEKLGEIMGKDITINNQTMSTDLGDLSNDEAARALYHVTSELEKPDTDFTTKSLKKGVKKLVANNTEKIKELKDMIDRVDFDINFQPIIDLNTRELDHYEMLGRFRSGETQDWITFAEDASLIADYDLAMAERAVNFIHYKADMVRSSFSVNFSHLSFETDDFFEKLQEQLGKKDLQGRLSIEITQAKRIKDLGKVTVFVKSLQNEGFSVALDNFGLHPGAPQLLKTFAPDKVKIDAVYWQNAQRSKKAQEMFENFLALCHDNKTKIIAKAIEDEDQLAFVKDTGITLGQGLLFSEVTSKPSYVPPL